ncbi:MAG: outer membrane protein assembly factor BamE [Pseudomonadota bacterium]
MPVFPQRVTRAALTLAVFLAAAGCSSFDNASQRVAGLVTPYKVEVVQGNFVSREQVEALQPGMSRQQVRDVLGTPLLASLFHADRWDYVFTLRRQGVEPQQRKLAVFFKGEVLDHVDADTMPSEAEFVSTLDNKRKNAKVPQLEASEEALKAAAVRPAGAASAPAAPQPAAPAETAYPPLEPATR